jgi:hypothetical protein
MVVVFDDRVFIFAIDDGGDLTWIVVGDPSFVIVDAGPGRATVIPWCPRR